MLRVGITGGIGSGKTTVCKVFEVLGIPVFYADLRAKLLMESDPDLIKGIKKKFGNEIYSADGTPDRRRLASIVFNDASRLEELNSLVHPAVFRDFELWTESCNAPYVLKEAAILFESGSDKDCDFTVVVTSPADLRIERVIARDMVGAADVKKRMEKQMSDEEKISMANFNLLNDEHQLLIPQILRLHEFFLEAGSGSR